MTESEAIRAMLARIEAGARPRVSDYNLPDAYRDVGPAFLGSLDAAQRLHEALIPNHTVDYVQQYDSGWLWQVERDFHGDTLGDAKKAACAWLLAILEARLKELEA